MKTGPEGLELIKHFEGCELKAYWCPAGVLTIGYGHTADVEEGDEIEQGDADRLLEADLEEFEHYVLQLVDPELTQNQFDAIVAWTFNLGPGNLKESTLLKRLNERDFDDVPYQIRRWTKAGGKELPGLVRRREAEALLFQGEDWRHV
jgi:lysozyme